MEIVIIHGEHHTKSYERLQKYVEVAKERNWEIARFDSETKDKKIPEIIATGSLFAKERLFIIEYKFLAKRDISWLNKNIDHIPGRVVIFAGDLLPSGVINSFKKIKKVELFKIPRNIFTFLTSFYPKNTKECLEILGEIKKEEPIEFIYSLLGRHLKDLYWVQKGASNIPYPSWRVMRLESQARKFDKDKLTQIISAMAHLDFQVKTSQANLEESLDLLIVENLE